MTLAFRRAAYTLDALIEAGVDPQVAHTLLVDGRRAVPERALVSLYRRQRTPEPIQEYVWGPDAEVLLQEPKQRQTSAKRVTPGGDR
jgi:hypothetical protein